MPEYELPGTEGRMMDYTTMDREALAAAYIEKIGYDPFEDDPNICEDVVREALRDHALAAALARRAAEHVAREEL